jgi:hypothetical protein
MFLPLESVFPRFGASVSMKNVTFFATWPPNRRRIRRMNRFCVVSSAAGSSSQSPWN